ncbi:phosphonate ABC transporter ATP-binding protein [Agrilactobacillus fermenti]|uniref:phosphonate ABC transporter ATP-binding protein n=1 Tax=Agrilactobacillus fermenti TaxID=2586909 RepID=UPI003A5BD0BA
MLEIKHLNKTYEAGRPALKDINVSIGKGQFVVILGPSGAGKTTLLRSINQLITSDSGEIDFEDQNLRLLNKQQLRQKRQKIGMIFQNYNLVERLTVIENVLHGRLGQKNLWQGMFGVFSQTEKQEALRLLQEVDLQGFELKNCSDLSGGQKQRVGIARALMQHPQIILCDEPVASLDPASSVMVLDLLKKLTVEKGITCIVNLHQVDLALDYADQIIGIKAGAIQINEPKSQVDKAMLQALYDKES